MAEYTYKLYIRKLFTLHQLIDIRVDLVIGPLSLSHLTPLIFSKSLKQNSVQIYIKVNMIRERFRQNYMVRGRLTKLLIKFLSDFDISL